MWEGRLWDPEMTYRASSTASGGARERPARPRREPGKTPGEAPAPPRGPQGGRPSDAPPMPLRCPSEIRTRTMPAGLDERQFAQTRACCVGLSPPVGPALRIDEKLGMCPGDTEKPRRKPREAQKKPRGKPCPEPSSWPCGSPPRPLADPSPEPDPAPCLTRKNGHEVDRIRLQSE